jgi:ribosomal protein L33
MIHIRCPKCGVLLETEDRYCGCPQCFCQMEVRRRPLIRRRPPQRQRRSWVLALLLVILVAVSGAAWLATLKPVYPNARCNECLSTFYMGDVNWMTDYQKLAITKRCPVCGRYNDVMSLSVLFRSP